jgi:hypothetical protein
MTDTLPPFPRWPALPASEYYGGSAPLTTIGRRRAYPPRPARATARRGPDSKRFPRSLHSGQRGRHPALPLRHRHGYAVDLHRDLPGQACGTRPRVPADPKVRGAHRHPAHIHRVRAGPAFKRPHTPVPRVCLPVSLTGPGPSGSARPTRLRRGCFHPHHRPVAEAAASFTQPLRRPGG